MIVNEKIVSSYYRRLIDKSAKLWQRISFWTKAADVEFNDGKTAEEKVGNIDGITSDFSTNDETISASSVLTNKAYRRFNEFTDGGKIKRLVIKDGKPCIEYIEKEGADPVLKKLGSGTVMYLGNGKKYDIKEKYDDYKNLTVDNFIVESGGWKRGNIGPINTSANANAHVDVWFTLNKEYDAKTGILKVGNEVGASIGYSEAQWEGGTTHIYPPIRVYLVVLPE